MTVPKPVVPVLREIYRATNADAGLKALEAFETGVLGADKTGCPWKAAGRCLCGVTRLRRGSPLC
jgi:hypothetical protein